jgi:phage terminase large subunit
MTDGNAGELSIRDVVGGGYGRFWRFRERYRVVKGSRASKKSTTAALWLIANITGTRGANALVCRKVYRTLRDSCYAQLKWAVKRLGLDAFWQCRESPMEMIYRPTGQKICFRGVDDPLKLSSITVEVGSLCWVWIEEAFELDEDEFLLIDDTIRGELDNPALFKQLTLTFNPWWATWLKSRFFDRADEGAPDILAMTTDYRCNEWLDEADKARFEQMRIQEPERYRVAGLGEWGVIGDSVFNAERLTARLSELAGHVARGMFSYAVRSVRRPDSAGDRLTITDIKWEDDSASGCIKLYEHPDPERYYVVGADPAGDGSDYFSAQVLDATDGRQVAVLRRQFDEDEFAKQCYCLGLLYNAAVISVEVNFSTYPTETLAALGYPHLWVRERRDTYTGKTVKAYGWRTTPGNRNAIIAELIAFVRDSPEALSDRTTIEEMLTFVRNEKGRPEAQAGAHDDTVMSYAIALQALSQQTRDAEADEPVGVEWSDSQWEDYERGSESERARMIELWGAPARDGGTARRREKPHVSAQRVTIVHTTPPDESQSVELDELGIGRSSGGGRW